MYYIAESLHVPQALLSVYGLYLSYNSIRNLQQYEEKSEKAAKWSNTAAKQLHKTRTTQASAATTVRSHSLDLSLCPHPPNSPADSKRPDVRLPKHIPPPRYGSKQHPQLPAVLPLAAASSDNTVCAVSRRQFLGT